jgi:spore germination cell wall hydrolase CwlJ-like protein
VSKTVPPQSRFASVGLTAIAFAILPNQIGFQDLGALIARQPSVSHRWQKYVFGAPPRMIEASLFSLPRPIGTAIPRAPLYALASVNPNEITGSLGREILGDAQAMQYPTVNRSRKRDALAARPRAPMPPLKPVAPAAEMMAMLAPNAASLDSAVAAPTASGKSIAAIEARSEAGLHFGAKPLGSPRTSIAPWSPGAAPQVVVPRADRDIKLAALTPPAGSDTASKPGLSIAPKGEVTGPGQRPLSPAERLKLSGRGRAEAEKCLANAVYFEARDEPVRAQIAVAQVVLNRAFSPFYPNNVCDVVYQNAHRHLACQFTFACDGKRNLVEEPDAWTRAKKIAADILDGKLWMPEVAKSTHYHDWWAHPNWVGEMRRIDRLGGLIFYRPRNWGDGAEEPKWGDPKTTAETTAKL